MLLGSTLQAIMGISVFAFVSLTATVKTRPPRLSKPNTGTFPAALTLPYTAEIAFVDFDLAGQFGRFLGAPFRDHHAHAMIEIRRCDLVDADEQAGVPATKCSGKQLV